MQQLLTKFDELYKAQAPLRYAKLQNGIDLRTVPKILQTLDVSYLPDELVELYAWKNGFESATSWANEFKDGAWHEIIPLDGSAHFSNLDLMYSTIDMWQKIAAEQGVQSYWKKGFVPFLLLQNYGMRVIDTVGYWGGNPGQIVSFDYQSAGGYTICCKNLQSWLELQITLLEKGVYFTQQGFEQISEHSKTLYDWDSEYKSKFPREIALG